MYPVTLCSLILTTLQPPYTAMYLVSRQVEKAGKLRLDSYDIVVDKCCIADGASHLVAVTSNNMVCIWTRGAPDTADE